MFFMDMFGGSFEHLRLMVIQSTLPRLSLPGWRDNFKQCTYKRRNGMGDKPTKNTNTESEQNTFLKMKPWHTIESAASLMALGRIVKGEEWRENAEIQAAYKALYDEAYEVEEYLQNRVTLGDMIEWVKNNPHVAEEMKKYPEVSQQELINVLARIFYLNEDGEISKTYNPGFRS